MSYKDKEQANAYARYYYHKNHTRVRREQTERVRRYRKRNLEYTKKVKDKPCADCGQRFPHYVMDFDHRDGEEKEANVANLAAAPYSLARLKKEISKCDVVCSNCHRERTYKHLLSEGRQCGQVV